MLTTIRLRPRRSRGSWALEIFVREGLAAALTAPAAELLLREAGAVRSPFETLMRMRPRTARSPSADPGRAGHDGSFAKGRALLELLARRPDEGRHLRPVWRRWTSRRDPRRRRPTIRSLSRRHSGPEKDEAVARFRTMSPYCWRRIRGEAATSSSPAHSSTSISLGTR